jgi:dipeptidyl aminopeptidase/acylaminoacyl peptidase
VPVQGLTGASGVKAERAVQVAFPTAAGRLQLAGTVTLPTGPLPVTGWPGLVLVPGSYPATRDGNPDIRQGWFGPQAPRRDLFRHLATQLAVRGVATIRYDKRGCGDSDGDYDDVDFEALVEDVSAALTALSAQSDVGALRIGLLGQSEGGIIVLEAARRDPRVAAVLAQGSPGRGLFETSSDEATLLPAIIDRMPERQRQAVIDAHVGSYLFMKCADQIRAAVTGSAPRLDLSVEGHRLTLNLDWIRQHLAHPADVIAAQLRIPVAFFAGEHDRNVHPDNALHLADVCRAAGNAEVTCRIFDGLDHGMRPGPADLEAGVAAIVSLDPPAPPAPEYVDAVAEWALATL